MSKDELQKIARKGLIIFTTAGNVDASGTATIWGEGANVEGFRFTNASATHTVAEANALHDRFGDKAQAWAEAQAWA